MGATSVGKRTRREGRGAWRTALAAGLLLVAAEPAAGNPLPALRLNPFQAHTHHAAQDDAARSIPRERLTPEARARVDAVLEHTSVFRRLPVRVVQCDPELYLFLVEHPDVVVNIWQELGLSQLALSQVDADTFELADAEGTEGWMQFIYRSRDTHVLYVEGTYTGPLFGRVLTGRGVMVLRSEYSKESDGRHYVASRLDAFMHIEPAGAEFLTKTFQPLVGRTADTNFIQTATFVGSLARTAEVNPVGMQRLARRLEGVHPLVRHEFAVLAGQVALRAAAFEAAEGPPMTASRPGQPRR